MPNAHKRWQARRDNQMRILNEAADRLQEVLNDIPFAGTVRIEHEKMLEHVAYVLGWENDSYEEGEDPDD